MPISGWGAEILCSKHKTRLPVHPCRREHVVQTLTCCTRTQLRADSKFSCSTRGLSPIIPGVLFRLPWIRSFTRTQEKKERKRNYTNYFYFGTLVKRSVNYIRMYIYIKHKLKMLSLDNVKERSFSFILFRDE